MRDGGALQMAPPVSGIYRSALPVIGSMRSSEVLQHGRGARFVRSRGSREETGAGGKGLPDRVAPKQQALLFCPSAGIGLGPTHKRTG